MCALVLMTAIFAAAEMGSHVAAQAPDDRPAVLVNPRAVEGKTATTIQEGIEMAIPGGKVLVLPGIYRETLNVTKGVTIEAIGGRSGDVIIAPAGVPVSTIEVATTEPVILRGLTVYVPGTNGIRGVGAVDLSVESTAVIARPLTATGTVNIIGNTFRNSTGHCLNNAIAYEVYTGRIERNRIVDVVQPCATAIGRSLPGAIWIGRRSVFPFPAVTPSVRYNDIAENAHAGLRIAANQTISIEASGPSGVGIGSGDAIVVQPGGATPLFSPFAVGPIAGTETGC